LAWKFLPEIHEHPFSISAADFGEINQYVKRVRCRAVVSEYYYALLSCFHVIFFLSKENDDDDDDDDDVA